MDKESQQKSLIKRKLAGQALALLNEKELLSADNEYGLESWRQRATDWMLRERMYRLLTEAGIDIDEPPEDYEAPTGVFSQLIIKYNDI